MGFVESAGELPNQPFEAGAEPVPALGPAAIAVAGTVAIPRAAPPPDIERLPPSENPEAAKVWEGTGRLVAPTGAALLASLSVPQMRYIMDRLTSFARNLMMNVNRISPSDLVQETLTGFLHNHRKGSPSHPEGVAFDSYQDLMMWLYGIQRRRASDMYRKLYRDKSEPVDPAEIRSNGEEDPTGIIVSHLVLPSLTQAIEILIPNPTSRFILYESVVYGTSRKEIAVALGIDAGAVRVRLHRTLEKLRKSDIGHLFADM